MCFAILKVQKALNEGDGVSARGAYVQSYVRSCTMNYCISIANLSSMLVCLKLFVISNNFIIVYVSFTIFSFTIYFSFTGFCLCRT